MLDQILKNKAGPERAEIMKKACQVRVYERKKFVREKDCREIGFILSPPPTVIPLRDSLNEFLVMDTPHFLSTTVILCCVFYRILTLFWRKHYNYRSRMITSRLVLSDPTVCLLCYILWNLSETSNFSHRIKQCIFRLWNDQTPPSLSRRNTEQCWWRCALFETYCQPISVIIDMKLSLYVELLSHSEREKWSKSCKLPCWKLLQVRFDLIDFAY